MLQHPKSSLRLVLLSSMPVFAVQILDASCRGPAAPCKLKDTVPIHRLFTLKLCKAVAKAAQEASLKHHNLDGLSQSLVIDLGRMQSEHQEALLLCSSIWTTMLR